MHFETTVTDLVAQRVARQPNAVAVCDPATAAMLSYSQLWERAGWLAAELIHLGVRPRDLVAVGQDRSVDLVVTCIGILRAGAAYVPLDAMAPPSRHGELLDDTGTNLVVCSAKRGCRYNDPWLNLPATARVICVPESMPAKGWSPETVTVGGNDPAYVAFTSGSTGRPKGVVVPHRAVVRLVSKPNFCTIEPGYRVANASNPAFDATTFEFWNTLTAGGTVVIFPSVTDLTIDEWVAMVDVAQIDVMFLTTSLFHTVARERPNAFGCLRTLIVGGEQLERSAVQQVLKAAPPGRLVNGYGPTETTTFAAYFDCSMQSLSDLDRLPIGYPLQDTSLHLLNDDLVAVPVGQIGELCIGGPGVAIGYLGREKLTAAKFVTDPVTGATIYRTGDMGRQLPSGAIELVGRADRQVKLRGFRIELEEIERATVATGLVDAAFVEKVGEGPYAALIGFVLPAKQAVADVSPLPSRLTQLLAARLPTYMLPARWLVLTKLPLGSTGKVDRSQLLMLLESPPGSQLCEDDTNDAGSVTDGLCALWREVLGVPRVRASDNFLELGGNSILVMQLAARIRQKYEVFVEPGTVLLADSAADLAAHVRQLEPVR